MKYAIQVWFDDDWVYLTRGKYNSFDLEVITWGNAEEARSAMAEMFQKASDKVRVVEYKNERTI